MPRDVDTILADGAAAHERFCGDGAALDRARLAGDLRAAIDAIKQRLIDEHVRNAAGQQPGA